MIRTHSLCGAVLLLLACVAAPAQDRDGPSEEKKPAGLYGMATNSLTSEPLPHVEIWLLRKVSGRFSSYRHTVTGRDGRFSLTGIEAGSYFVTAERNGYHRVDVDVPVSSDPPMLSLKPGEEIKDILLRLEPDVVIAGRVVDTDGAPLERIKVEALGSAGWFSDETDDRGEFVIGSLSPGRYLLRASLSQPQLPEVRKDGSVAVNYGVTYFPSTRTAGGAVSVRVQAGQESNFEIRMLPALILHISGDVSGETEGRRPDVKLENWWDEYPRPISIDKKGAFTFARVPPGRYRLYAEDQNGKSAPVLIDLTNASIEGIHLALLPPVGLAGYIRDEDWKRMRAQIKEDKNEDAPEIRLEQFGFFIPQVSYKSTLSDDGRFNIKDVAPGRYHVRMWGGPKNFYFKSLQIGEREFRDGTLEIGGGPVQQEMLIELGADGAEVSGTVRDVNDGVGGALVLLLAEDASFSAVAGGAYASEDGSYVIRGIAPGKYKLLALKTKHKAVLLLDETLELDRNVIEKIEVRAGDRITQDLKVGAH